MYVFITRIAFIFLKYNGEYKIVYIYGNERVGMKIRYFFCIFSFALYLYGSDAKHVVHYNSKRHAGKVYNMIKADWNILVGDLGRYSRAKVDSWFADTELIKKVYLVHKKVAGFITYKVLVDDLKKKYGYIEMLCVDKKFRRLGIGNGLVEFAVQELLSMGCEYITIDVWCFNSSAMQLYQKLGFIQRDSWYEYTSDGVQTEKAYRLQKSFIV